MTKRFVLVLTCVVVAASTALAAPKTVPPKGKATISLPGDAGMAFKPGPGVGAAQANCLTCHSSAYVSTQPVLSKAQWTAEVTKMKNVYGAPIPDDVLTGIVDNILLPLLTTAAT